MSKHKSKKMIFILLVILMSAFYFGCEKKTDQSEELTENTDTEIIKADTSSDDPIEEVEETVEEKAQHQ